MGILMSNFGEFILWAIFKIHSLIYSILKAELHG